MKEIDFRSFLSKNLLKKRERKIGLVKGSLMIMDISGFTELSERMSNFGKEGTEELTRVLNNYFSSMLDVIGKYSGIPLQFGGDSILVGFYGDKDTSKKLSLSCAISLMNEIKKFKSIDTIAGKASISMKIVIESGEWGECILGDNRRSVLFLSGDLIKRLAQYEDKANPNEIWVNGRVEKTNEEFQNIENKPSFSKEIEESIDKESISKFIPEGVSEFIKSGVSGEHRAVSTLFVNLYGYDEEYPEINYINNVFLIIIDIIEKYKGSINKIDINTIGIKIMITFGAPFSQEKSTEFAVLSAMEINNIKNPFKLCMGISTGFVYAGVVGSEYQKEYTVIGDSVNIAARLMSVAKVDQILIDESTKRVVSDFFDFDEIPPITLKGKSKNIKIFIPKKEIQRKFYSSNFIGRESEAKEIMNMIQMGNSFIFITGERGMGKTRLINEICSRLDNNYKILIGNVSELKYSFSGFYSMIAKEAGINPEDPDDQKGIKLEEHIRSFKNEELNKKITFIGSMLFNIKYPGSIYEKVEPKLKIENLKDALRYYIESQKEKKIIIVLDDIHFLTEADVGIINYLTRILLTVSDRKKDISFIFVGIASPFDRLLTVPKNVKCFHFNLEPLNKIFMNKLILEVLKNKKLPEDISDLLIKKSIGNPFYIQQLLLNIIEKGFIKETETEWVKTEKFNEKELPENIWAAIMSRIDRLDIMVKECLVIGSVIGLKFNANLISNILNADVEKYLKITVKEGLTYVKISKDIEYIFTNSVIRDVIYNSILTERKKQLHRLVAQTIEKLYGSNNIDFYRILAYHYNNAHEWEKAYEYSLKAGEYAKENFKNEEAKELLKNALIISNEKLHRKPDIKIYETLGEVYEILGSYNEAMNIYDEMINNNKNDKLIMTMGLRLKANILQNQSRYDEALKILDEAVKICSELPKSGKTKVEYGHIFELISWIYRLRCYYKNSLEIGYTTLEELQKYSIEKNESNKALKKIIGNLYNNIGMIHSVQGEYKKAIEFFEKFLETSKELGNKRDVGTAYNNLGNVYANKSEYKKALEYYQKKLRISEEIGDKRGIGIAYNNISFVKTELGDYSEAIECCYKNLQISEELDDKRGKGLAYGNLGLVYTNLGEYDIALKFLKESLKISEEINDILGIAIVNGDIGDLYFDKGEYERAVEFYKKYYELSEKIGFKRGIGISSKNLGSIYIELKDLEKSEKWLLKAKEIFESIDDKHYLIKTLNLLSSIELEMFHINSAKEYVYAALEISRNYDIKEGEAQSLISLGKITLIDSRDYGKNKIGNELFEKGINILTESGLLKNIGEAYLDYGKTLRKIGDKDYIKYFDKAIEIFNEMKNQEKCKRIEKLKEIY